MSSVPPPPFPPLTVEENIRFGLESEGYSEEKISEKIKEFIDLLGVSDILHRYPRTLSGGERQSATLARSLVMDPEILLLDKPVRALDVPSQEKIMRELKKIHNETDITTMHVTHSREEAIRLGDPIGIMNDGKIVQTGNTTQVFKKPNSEFVAKFIGTENIFEGKSKVRGRIAKINLNRDVEIEAVSNREGNFKACIRPEEIMVSKNPIKTSGRNTLKGEIVGLSERQSTIQLKIDAGIDLTATITKKSYSDMELKLGEEIHLAFKATAVHLI